MTEDWGDKAPAGDQYVIAGQQGNWTGIWYAGTIGWFYNPQGAGQTARYTGAWVVTPRPGLASVPVYGSAFPEASEYPPGVAVRVNDPLAYTIKAGQSYVTAGEVPDGYYNAITFNSSTPYDHTIIFGKARYYEILLNHRIYYVHAADVMLKHLALTRPRAAPPAGLPPRPAGGMRITAWNQTACTSSQRDLPGATVREDRATGAWPWSGNRKTTCA